MRDDVLCLEDNVKACDSITTFLNGVELATFLTDEYAQSAVAYQFIIIGEAVGLLSEELKAKHSTVEWQRARGLRNIAAHTYFAMDWRVIWDTVRSDLPMMRRQVEAILSSDFLDSG